MRASLRLRWLVMPALLLLFTSCLHTQDRYDRVAVIEDDSVAMFYDDLAPYGEWFAVSGYGWVWRPHRTVVGSGFTPYVSDGRWVYTRYGWVFDSRYRWGWAAFHYGRWLHHPRYSWFWVPDTVWGPAWVDWRFGAGHVAWYPLPPRHPTHLETGLQPVHFVVPAERFPHGGYERHRLPPHRARPVLEETRPVPPVAVGPGGLKPVGPPPGEVEELADVTLQSRPLTPRVPAREGVIAPPEAEVSAPAVPPLRPQRERPVLAEPDPLRPMPPPRAPDVDPSPRAPPTVLPPPSAPEREAPALRPVLPPPRAPEPPDRIVPVPERRPAPEPRGRVAPPPRPAPAPAPRAAPPTVRPPPAREAPPAPPAVRPAPPPSAPAPRAPAPASPVRPPPRPESTGSPVLKPAPAPAE